MLRNNHVLHSFSSIALLKSKALLSVILMLVLGVPLLRAAEIRGRVMDSQGLVVSGATVLLRGLGVQRESRTTREGEYWFSVSQPGNYRLRILAEGFSAAERDITSAETDLISDFSLSVAGVHEGIVVIASREEATTGQTVLPSAVLDKERLERSMPVNLAQALTEIPGVTWTNAGAFRSRPVIRGLSSNRILVLVDGERLNNGRTSTNDAGIETSLVDINQIDQVEVVKGPGSVLFGSDAFGGVVNIRTRTLERSDGFRWSARVRNQFDTASNGRQSALGLSASYKWLALRADGALNDFDDYSSPDGVVFGSGVRQNSGSGEVRVYPSAGQSAYVKFTYNGGYDFGLPSLAPNPTFFATFPFSKLRKFSAGYSVSLNSNALSNVQARGYQQRQNRDFLNILRQPGFSLLSDTITDVVSWGFDVQATSLLKNRHVFTYGVSAYRDENRDQRLQLMNPGTPGERVLSRAPSVPNSQITGLGFFLQDQIQVSSSLRVLAGVRGDRFRLNVFDTPNFDPQAFAAITNERTDSAVSGNAGASLKLREGWTVTGNIARAFREPNLFERFFFGRGSVGGFIVPNPTLEPETSLQFDAGTRIERSRIRASLNYFHNTISNLIVTGPGSFQGSTVISGQPVRQNFNVDESRIQGMESTFEYSLAAGSSAFTPFTNLTWLRGTNLTNGQPLPLIAPFIASSGLRWNHRRSATWSEVAGYITKGTDRVPTGFQPLSGYATFAVRGGHDLTHESPFGRRVLPNAVRSLGLQFAVENLGDRNYRGLFESVPEAGRALRVGLSFNLGSGE